MSRSEGTPFMIDDAGGATVKFTDIEIVDEEVMIMKGFFTILLCMLMVLAAAGCRRQPEPTQAEAPPEAKPSPLPALWTEVQELFFQGDTNGAISRLEGALTETELSDYTPDILRELIRMELSLNMTNEARQAFIDAAEADPESAAPAIGILESMMLQSQDYDGLLEWCDYLEGLPLDESAKVRVMSYRLQVYRATGDAEALQTLFTRAVEELPESSARSLISRGLNGLLNDKAYDELDAALAHVSAIAAGKSDILKLVTGVRIRLLIAQGELEAASHALKAAATELDQREQAQLLNALVEKVTESGDQAFADRLCEEAFEDSEPDSPVYRTATRHWLRSAREAGNGDLVQQRLSRIVQRGGSVSGLIRLVGNYFYFVIDKGDDDALRALLADCETLRSQAASEDDKTRVVSFLLDGSFMLRDYDQALALLEEGIPGKDAQWHATLIPKVKAHKALAEDRIEDAIAMFREFMREVAMIDEDFPDPMTGTMVPGEVILGLNALRIADLWSSLGQEEKAAAAREEGRQYYQQALEKTDRHSEAYKEIQQKLEQIP